MVVVVWNQQASILLKLPNDQTRFKKCFFLSTTWPAEGLRY